MRELMLTTGLEIVLSLSENVVQANNIRRVEGALTRLEIDNSQRVAELYMRYKHRMEPDVRRRFERKMISAACHLPGSAPKIGTAPMNLAIPYKQRGF